MQHPCRRGNCHHHAIHQSWMDHSEKNANVRMVNPICHANNRPASVWSPARNALTTRTQAREALVSATRWAEHVPSERENPVHYLCLRAAGDTLGHAHRLISTRRPSSAPPTLNYDCHQQIHTPARAQSSICGTDSDSRTTETGDSWSGGRYEDGQPRPYGNADGADASYIWHDPHVADFDYTVTEVAAAIILRQDELGSS